LRFGCLVHVYLPAGTIILLVGHVRHDYATAPKARLGPQGNSAVSPTVLARCVPNKVGGTWPPMKLVGCVSLSGFRRMPFAASIAYLLLQVRKITKQRHYQTDPTCVAQGSRGHGSDRRDIAR